MILRSSIIAFSILLLATPSWAQRNRCGTLQRETLAPGVSVDPSDCGYWTNSPQSEYEPTFFYDIPVVFHVIQDSSGNGFLSEATIQDQIDVLNEDFQAIAGSPGAPGTNGKIRFHLANSDPEGNPTNGITYTTNDTWYMDSGNYWDPRAWDTNRYYNIYTNVIPCCYGYVADFPQTGIVGTNEDRVVLWWEAVGKEPTSGWPGNMGRTATHETGHYLGLYHTFDSGCGSSTDCYGTGDLICDTNQERRPSYGCPTSKTSCGSEDPFHNYMDYTDDLCLWEFTPEQVNRMRCVLENWRPDVWESHAPTLSVTNLLAGQFADVLVTDTTPGKMVYTAYSLAGNGPLNSPWGDLALSSPYHPLRNGRSNASGEIQWQVFVPASTFGIPIWTQALDITAGKLSNGLALVVQ